MDRSSRLPNIPPGRVAQRLKALQGSSSDNVRSTDTTSKRTSLSTFDSVTSPKASRYETSEVPPQQAHSEADGQKLQEQADVTELPTTKLTPKHDRFSDSQASEQNDCGVPLRSSESRSDSEDEPEPAEKTEDVLEDVRSRLNSVRKIVRRERSQSGQGRDDMLNELGNMLDTAIATTMTPLNTPALQPRTPLMTGRGVSLSPTKQSRSPVQRLRSQSVKNEKSLHVRLNSRPPAPRDDESRAARTEVPTRVQSPEFVDTLVPLQFNSPFDRYRNRQVSEPGTSFPRPPGFPLSSPVRERTLLWESMSRAAIEEEDSIKCPHFVTRFHPVSPKAQSPTKPKVATPPIPLALPQLVEADRRSKYEEIAGAGDSVEKTQESAPASSSLRYSRFVSSKWPQKIQFVSSGTTTIQESPSIAEASVDHEVHLSDPRQSNVKDKIKNLLTPAERKPSSGVIEQNRSDKSEEPTTQVRELRASVESMRINRNKLAHLQALPEELKSLYSNDGGLSMSQAFGSLADNDETGTSSSKVMSRRPTFKHQPIPSPEPPRAASPVKASADSPIRGRPGRANSPGGRPYSVDHRFALSPSRSDSRGSRGSLTFNIKARVSPGRGLGKKDDTELFVTANIESDDSDEGR